MSGFFSRIMNVIAETIQKAQIDTFQQADHPRITTFLIKVTARCNLNCDYCYVFNHADQSWKKMPSVLSSENRVILAKRIGEYAEKEGLKHILVLFHGGEPLLVGIERLMEIVRLVRQEVSKEIKVDFSLQTNGTLLSKENLDILSKENVGVSLSLDGPRQVNDLHRLNHKSHSTFDATFRGYKLLKESPNIFTGIIGVIDPRVPPREVISFFAELEPPQLDFLLPDANYLAPPFLREKNTNIYVDWLINAFNVWYDDYPELNVRLFEGLIGTISGLPSQTDAFGFGDVSLLTIETDGFYHDLDVLKITQEGISSLDCHIKDYAIDEVILSPKIQSHRKLLSFEGLSDTCKACPEVNICGGGAVPHRYDKNGFQNPTIYCREMLSLISHIRRRLIETVSLTAQEKITSPVTGFENFDVLKYEKPAFDNPFLKKVHEKWSIDAIERFFKVLDYISSTYDNFQDLCNSFKERPKNVLKRLSTRPSTILWAKVFEQFQKGLRMYDIEGKAVHPDVNYLNYLYNISPSEDFEVHKEDYWLRGTFGNSIIFEPPEIREEGLKIFQEAMKIIEEYSPELKKEIELLSRHIQFIRDPSAHPEKIVSFSDNAVPGALYVSIRKGEGYIDPYDLADSIIHEHRHQKLYLLEQYIPAVQSDTPLVPSPWREELRPVSGVYHGAFVFHNLKDYWQFISQNRTGGLKEKALAQMNFSRESLSKALQTLKSADITPAGRNILGEFERTIGNV